jgi:hypothetical protein
MYAEEARINSFIYFQLLLPDGFIPNFSVLTQLNHCLTMQPGQNKRSHLAVACEEWKKLQKYIAGQKVIIDGNSLDLAAVVAVS